MYTFVKLPSERDSNCGYPVRDWNKSESTGIGMPQKLQPVLLSSTPLQAEYEVGMTDEERSDSGTFLYT